MVLAEGSSLPHTSTNALLAVGIFNRLRDCASLSTGTICTSVCTSVQCWRFNHLNTHTDMPLIALIWLRTGFGCVGYTDVCLIEVCVYTGLVGSYLSFYWVQCSCPSLRVFIRPTIMEFSCITEIALTKLISSHRYPHAGPQGVCRLCVHGVCDRLGGIGVNHFNRAYRGIEETWGYLLLKELKNSITFVSESFVTSGSNLYVTVFPLPAVLV